MFARTVMTPRAPTPTTELGEMPAIAKELSEESSEDGDDCTDEDEDAEPHPPSLASQLDAGAYPVLEKHTDVRNNSKNLTVPTARPSSLPGSLDVDLLHSRMTSILSWDRLVSYLVIYGRAAFSAEQYEDLRLILGGILANGGRVELHPYKTIRRHMRTTLGAWCFPPAVSSL